MNTQGIVSKIAKELELKEVQVHNTVDLLFKEECTIPFVARYRKERTGSMDEVKIRDVRDRFLYLQELEGNKEKYLKVVAEHCSKNPDLLKRLPEIEKKFRDCNTKQELEDLYLPYKPKRRTRAQVAREKGLEGLADALFKADPSVASCDVLASAYVTADRTDIEESLRVKNTVEALAGAADILAERFSEQSDVRALVRRLSHETGCLVSKKIETTKDKPTSELATAPSQGKKRDDEDKAQKFQNYFDYREPLNTAAGHRVMAVRRGEAEKVLRVLIDVDDDRIVHEIQSLILAGTPRSTAVKQWLDVMIADSYKRMLSPSIETELRLELKTRAEEEAIKVFAKNLENLLLLPPIPHTVVMGVDPGLRTGSKIAVVSETGKLLAHTTVYPIPDKPDAPKSMAAREEIGKLLKDHKVNYIAIGNGTGSREISKLIVAILRGNEMTNIKRLFVNEAGASVYSTDDIAREEFPDLDPTIRSAVSIARRLQDPLAELVKIDPRSIGVGQYQHDVNVNRLRSSLEEVVESCVNRVGVNVNTASYRLLSYVSGIGPMLAKGIVKFRDQKGSFNSRQDLLEITGFGAKVYTLAAGFLRVPTGSNPLDNSSVHPESYEIVEQIVRDLNCEIHELVGNPQRVATVNLEKYVTSRVGMPTLKDISQELIKPGRDPREDGARLAYSDDIAEISDLRVGMELQGSVTNVTNFGAFVDIGVHQDGLVHISELSDQFVKDPATVVGVGDIVKVRVIDVDVGRKRISLSCRAAPKVTAPEATPTTNPQRSGQNGRPQQQQRGGDHRQQNQQQRPQRPPEPKRPQFTLDDLVNKFNKR